jgi:hypothetical protein
MQNRLQLFLRKIYLEKTPAGSSSCPFGKYRVSPGFLKSIPTINSSHPNNFITSFCYAWSGSRETSDRNWSRIYCSKEFNMNSKKLLLVIPVVSALVLALAVGVMAFSSSQAAYGDFALLTQDDEMEQPGPREGGFGSMRAFGHGGRFGLRTGFDYDAYIAEELGVTVEELQAARQAAHEAALEQAVEEGTLSQEQAELILAGQALKQYIDPLEILSEALGIDAAEIEAAREAGEPLHDLFGDMEPEEIREALQAAYEDAVDQAIEAGVITADHAEQLQNKGFPGRLLGKHGGGFHRPGGFPFPEPAPDSEIES